MSPAHSSGAAAVSEWFVAALEPAIEALHISQAFAGIVVVAIAGNPETALALPPSILVRAVVSAEAENRRLRKRARKDQARQRKLRERLQELQLSEAARQSRLQTLEDVIGALHGNLTDLRQEREFLRQWAPSKLTRPAELPQPEDHR